MNNKWLGALVLVLLTSTVYAGTITWSGFAFQTLYNSSGSQLTTDNMLIQLVLDVNNDTVVGNMISSGQLGIGTETALGGVNVAANADDDIVGTWNAGAWKWVASSASSVINQHVGATIVSDVGATHYSQNFYLRWFNNTSQGAATEAGLIYNPTWVTPAAPAGADPEGNVVALYTYGTAGDSGSENLAGSPDGWATVAPVPEPTTMALMGLGLAAVAVRRRFSKKA
jgi:hypothetical protein